MEFFTELTDDHRAFVAKQPVFFVATAAPDARINLSPKGMDSFRILSPAKVAYLDVGGSGNETHAHLAADGRITARSTATVVTVDKSDGNLLMWMAPVVDFDNHTVEVR